MSIKRIILYFVSLVLLFIFSVIFVINFTLFSEDLGPGEITGAANSNEFIEDKFDRQSVAKNDLLDLFVFIFLNLRLFTFYYVILCFIKIKNWLKGTKLML